MKALVGAFNQEKALVGAFSVIVQPVVEPMERFAALVAITRSSHTSSQTQHRGGTNTRHQNIAAGAGGPNMRVQLRGAEYCVSGLQPSSVLASCASSTPSPL